MGFFIKVKRMNQKKVVSLSITIALIVLLIVILSLMNIKINGIEAIALGIACGVFVGITEDSKYTKGLHESARDFIYGSVKSKKVLFSELALGARFKYEGSEDVWVKIDVDPKDACIAKWDENLKDKAWIGQPVCSLNDDGADQYVLLVL